MAVSKEDILETISNMTVLEVVELVEAMEEKFGVSAAAMAAPAAAAPAAGPEAVGAFRSQASCNVIAARFPVPCFRVAVAAPPGPCAAL